MLNMEKVGNLDFGAAAELSSCVIEEKAEVKDLKFSVKLDLEDEVQDEMSDLLAGIEKAKAALRKSIL